VRAAFLVPVSLQKSIAFTVIRAILAILTPVLRMPGLPSSLVILLVGLIIGIGGHFVSLPLSFSGPLAIGLGAEPLGLDSGIGRHQALAMGASNLGGHSFLLIEAVDGMTGLLQEE
jgi:hypothetical protein